MEGGVCVFVFGKVTKMVAIARAHVCLRVGDVTERAFNFVQIWDIHFKINDRVYLSIVLS
jgi:hypothetical protein